MRMCTSVLTPTIMSGLTPSIMSGLPAFPMALMRPFLTPMSAYNSKLSVWSVRQCEKKERTL